MGAPVVHFEIGGRDSAKLGSFYSAMFDWKATQYGPSANMIDTGTPQGIMGHITQLGHEPFNYCLVYVQVDDIPAALAKAEFLGGKTKVSATDVPGMGQFAWFTDPEGNLVGLWKPVKPG